MIGAWDVKCPVLTEQPAGRSAQRTDRIWRLIRQELRSTLIRSGSISVHFADMTC